MRWRESDRSSVVGGDLFYAAGLAILSWTFVWAGGHWLVALAGTLGAVAFAVWSIWFRKALGTVLDGDTLVERRQRRDVRIAVGDITSIEYAWIPYSGGSLFVRGRTGETVELGLGNPDRLELGRQLHKRKPRLAFSPRVERELGYLD